MSSALESNRNAGVSTHSEPGGGTDEVNVGQGGGHAGGTRRRREKRSMFEILGPDEVSSRT